MRAKYTLRIYGKVVRAGEELSIDKNLEDKLLKAGLIESTMTEPAEKATKPKSKKRIRK